MTTSTPTVSASCQSVFQSITLLTYACSHTLPRRRDARTVASPASIGPPTAGCATLCGRCPAIQYASAFAARLVGLRHHLLSLTALYAAAGGDGEGDQLAAGDDTSKPASQVASEQADLIADRVVQKLLGEP